MAFVSVTRLRIASPLVYPWALWRSLLAARQAARALGLIDGKLLRDRGRVLWTATAWDERAAMRLYRDGGLHQALMPKLVRWCDEAAVAHWLQEGAELPGWDEVARRIQQDGRASRVRRPSPDHQAFRIAPVRAHGLTRELPLSVFRGRSSEAPLKAPAADRPL